MELLFKDVSKLIKCTSFPWYIIWKTERENCSVFGCFMRTEDVQHELHKLEGIRVGCCSDRVHGFDCECSENNDLSNANSTTRRTDLEGGGRVGVGN